MFPVSWATGNSHPLEFVPLCAECWQDNATADKESFVSLWNPIASSYGLPNYQWNQLQHCTVTNRAEWNIEDEHVYFLRI